MSLEDRTHTALHVLKGATAKVLGIKWTTGVSVKGNHGRLTVQCEQKPTDDEIQKIQKEANKKIQDNVPVEVLEMDRDEAEVRWGDLIYDVFPIPDSITRLSICHIKDWNVNACNKNHTRTTGEIGELKISKARYRNSKKVLEISYDITA